jgi:hypothetical protein
MDKAMLMEILMKMFGGDAQQAEMLVGEAQQEGQPNACASQEPGEEAGEPCAEDVAHAANQEAGEQTAADIVEQTTADAQAAGESTAAHQQHAGESPSHES